MAKEPQVNIPESMPDEAEAELQSHFTEPSYHISYEDGSEVYFNLGDVVSIFSEKRDDNMVYSVALISGFDFEISQDYYNELKDLKNWHDGMNDGKYHLDENKK